MSSNTEVTIENRAADALSRRRALIFTMSAKVVGFEKIKDTYESCSNFGEIFTVLRDDDS